VTVLQLDNIEKSFDGLTAVDEVSLSVAEGELVCLLGPSGCGKSTTLRTIAGFEAPDTGTVHINGRDVTATPPDDRQCSMVFQDWALFPNKTVLENVAFGLKMDGVSAADRQNKAQETLSLVEMSDHAGDMPRQLSGGQKQRVALARSLTLDPEILLLDEPLSNLDRKLRESMQLELKEIQRQTEKTMVYVTHDQDEAFTLADRIGILNEGRVVQTGAPAEVYTDPTNQFVESFLGTTNFLSCTVAATRVTEAVAGEATDGGARVRLETPLGEPLLAPDGANRLTTGDAVTASIRPEQLTVSAERPPSDGRRDRAFTATGTIRRRLHRGSRIRYEIESGDAQLATERRISDRLDVTEDATVYLSCSTGAVTYFDAAGRRLR
jgi:ABC-type spermidine/putrescine transport systems, ATPase components